MASADFGDGGASKLRLKAYSLLPGSKDSDYSFASSTLKGSANISEFAEQVGLHQLVTTFYVTA